MSGVGFYGKLPGAGDFVGRRLPSDFVDVWDRHFQRAVETSRGELGERWTTAWRNGPTWRFLLAPQVSGSGSWCGLTGPALDRLGRAFPMVLAAPCDGDLAGLACNHAWFDTLELVYRNAQLEAVSVEIFDSHVASLPHPSAVTTNLSALWSGLPWDSGQWQLKTAGAAAAGLMLTEAWRQLGMRPGPWCLWWTEGAARIVATRGLPRSYAALLEPPASEGHEGAAYSGALASPAVNDFAPAAASLPSEQTRPVQSDWLAHEWPREPSTLESSNTTLWFDEGRALVLSADDGPYDARRVAASGIRELMATGGADPASQRTALSSLHARLRGASEGIRGTRGTTRENGAALVVRFDGPYVRFLRAGAATLWYWRDNQLHAGFVERTAGAGGEFDDLLFGDAWLDMPGIGTASEPDYEEGAIRLEPGDRLLLLVTRDLVLLPRDCLAEALAQASCDEAQAHLARRAGLGMPSSQWPLAVVDIRP